MKDVLPERKVKDKKEETNDEEKRWKEEARMKER